MKKGVILSGGKGTRLLPATRTQNKHLLPILNVPMILYPIHSLMELGVEDILIVTGGGHVGGFAEFLGDGSRYGCNLTYRVQSEALGIANALDIAQDFVRGEDLFAVILGDNFFGADLIEYKDLVTRPTIFTSLVNDVYRFGAFIKEENKIVEKPKGKVHGLAVTGLYVYDQEVFSMIDKLEPSARGEYEITDINNEYLGKKNMDVLHLDMFWSDMGTPNSMYRTIKYAVDTGYSLDFQE